MDWRDDADFMQRLVDAWSNHQRFQELAESLTPLTLDPNEIREVEEAIEEVAAKVWNGFTLKLIGSSLIGTAIRKRQGQSDRDYVLETDQTVTAEEWKEFAEHLEEDHRFQYVFQGKKAIKLRDQRLQLEWEVVPASGHFSYYLVTFPTLDGTASTEERNTQRLQYFQKYPGAKHAVKVLKRLCPQLKGNMVEALAFRQGTDCPTLAGRDTSGLSLFKHLIQLLADREWMSDPNSPLDVLLQDAIKFGTEDEVETILSTAKCIAEDLRKRTGGPTDGEFSTKIVKQIMQGLGFTVAFLLVLLVHQEFWLAVLPRSWVDQSVRPQTYGCPEGSCFCSDLRDSCFECMRWDNYTAFNCELLGVRLNRCRLTFCIAVANWFLHFWIVGAASTVALRHGKQPVDLCAVSWCVLVASSLVLVYYLCLALSLKNFAFFSGLLTAQQGLCIAISVLVLGVILVTGPRNRGLTPHQQVLKIGAQTFFLTVFGLEILTSIWLRLDQTDLVRGSNIFYTLSLLFQFILSVYTMTSSSEENRAQAGIMVVVQALWLLADFWFWGGLTFWPELQQKCNLLMVCCCFVLFAFKLRWSLYLAQCLRGAGRVPPTGRWRRLALPLLSRVYGTDVHARSE